jgi:hypothetical protein
MANTLRYDMLSQQEKNEFTTRCNVLVKYIREGDRLVEETHSLGWYLKGALTLGVYSVAKLASLAATGAEVVWARHKVTTFLKSVAEKYECNDIDVSTFPWPEEIESWSTL